MELQVIDEITARKGLLMARAINHNLRKQIISILATDGEMSVTDIFTHQKFRDRETGVYLEQSLASQHLAILRKANIVKTRRVGKQVMYRVNELVLDQAVEHLSRLASLFGQAEAA